MEPHQIYTIVHCDFEYTCSLNWRNLNPTEDPKVRYCTECKKNVNLCTTNEEIDYAEERGLCVAHPLYTEKALKEIRDYEAGISKNPFIVEMSMGLPSNRK